MIQPRRGPGFALEAPQRRLVSEERSHHHLRGDQPLEPQIGRLEHDAHAAAAQRALQPILAFERPLDRQRQFQLGSVGRATRVRAVVAETARRAFLQEADAALLQPGQHVSPDVRVRANLVLQVLVLADAADLRGDAFEQPAIRRGIRLVRLSLAEEQEAHQPVVSIWNRHDQPDAEILEPAPLIVRQRRVETGRVVSSGSRAVHDPEHGVTLRQRATRENPGGGMSGDHLAPFLGAIEHVQRGRVQHRFDPRAHQVRDLSGGILLTHLVDELQQHLLLLVGSRERTGDRAPSRAAIGIAGLRQSPRWRSDSASPNRPSASGGRCGSDSVGSTARSRQTGGRGVHAARCARAGTGRRGAPAP